MSNSYLKISHLPILSQSALSTYMGKPQLNALTTNFGYYNLSNLTIKTPISNGNGNTPVIEIVLYPYVNDFNIGDILEAPQNENETLKRFAIIKVNNGPSEYYEINADGNIDWNLTSSLYINDYINKVSLSFFYLENNNDEWIEKYNINETYSINYNNLDINLISSIALSGIDIRSIILSCNDIHNLALPINNNLNRLHISTSHLHHGLAIYRSYKNIDNNDSFSVKINGNYFNYFELYCRNDVTVENGDIGPQNNYSMRFAKFINMDLTPYIQNNLTINNTINYDIVRTYNITERDN